MDYNEDDVSISSLINDSTSEAELDAIESAVAAERASRLTIQKRHAELFLMRLHKLAARKMAERQNSDE